jgi:PAS domain S-box-containing protein
MAAKAPVSREFRLLFEQNPQPMWVYDLESLRFLAVNAAAEATYGYSRAEFLAMRITDIRPATDVPALLAAVAGTGKPLDSSGIWRHRHCDGRIMLVEISSHAITFEGRASRMVLATDVTERQTALDALRASNEHYEAQYRALVALTRGGNLQAGEAALREITETTTRTLDVERASVWLFTPARDAIVARDLYERSISRHSNGPVLEATAFPAYFRALAESDVIAASDAERDERTSEFTDVYLRPNRIGAMLDAPILAGGQLAGVLCLEHVGTAREWSTGERHFAMSAANLISLVLTQRVRADSEARLRTILDSEPECVKVVSLDGVLVDMNAAGLRMVEADATNAVIGAPVEPLIHPDDRPAFALLHNRVAAGESGQLEFRLLGLRGTTRWVETHAAPLRDASGVISGVLSVTRDVTERRRNIEALATSERLTGLILRSAADGIHGLDAQGRILFGNPAAATMLGYDEEDLVGRDSHSLIHHHHGDGRPYPLEECPIHRTLQDGRPRHVDGESFFRRDGSSFRVDYVCSPMTDEADVVTGVVVTFRDTTARLQAEAALHESQRRLTTLMGNLPGMAYRCSNDPHWSMEFASEGATALTGFTPAQLMHGGNATFGSLIHPEDRERVWTTVQQAVGAAVPFETEYRITAADGVEKWVWERGQPVYDPDGRLRGLEGLVTDVTARRRMEEQRRVSEERFRLLARATTDAIWDWDVETNALWWNEGFETLFGFARAEVEPTLESWTTRIHPEDADRVLTGLHHAIDAGHSNWSDEYRFSRKDGSFAYVLDRGHVIRDREGRLVRMIGGMTDLTERRQLETQLLQSQRMETVGRLAGGVAHDFNNLLSVILGTIDVNLSSIDVDTPLHTDLQEVRRAGERAAALTRQLLAFSRRQILQPRVLNLNTTVTDTLTMLRRLIGEDIEIRFAPASDLANVTADPSQFEQVLVNLAVNARDAMREGGTLTIQTRNVVLDEAFAGTHPSARPGPHVMLAVSDTGIGMDRATRERIFEPFFTTKPPGEGTGLGLAMVYGIVQQSDGSIWVYSEPGRGTTFKIYLPKVDEEVEPDVVHAADRTAGGTETVLLVEDEPALRKLAERVLRNSGYTVVSAENGPQALEVVERHVGPLDLLLTDVVMPHMSGPELARRITDRKPGAHIIYMSGYTDDEMVRRGVPEGHARFLNKPFTVKDLTRIVREALDS